MKVIGIIKNKNKSDVYDIHHNIDFKFFKDQKPNFFANGLLVENSGRHASGILISDNKLNQSDIPILKAKGELVTAVQEGMEDREVSELGYMKLDILGLTTAGIVNDTFKLVEKKYNIKNLEQTLLKSKFDDNKIWEEFGKGNCQDIFQFGSNGMITLIKQIQPNNIYELTAINSLYRPANIEANMIEEYINNRLNPDRAKIKVNSIFPGLYELLEETYGAIIYQEQVMFVLQKVGGFTLAESDQARKTLKKLYKKGSENEQNSQFTEIINKFKEGAIKKGVTEDKAENLLQILSKYTGYTFNKCLSGDTLVTTDKGKKKIKNCKKGDVSVSFDFKTKKVYKTNIKDLHKNGKKLLYSIETENGDIIKCTLDHKFMIKDGTMKSLKYILDNDLEIVSI